MSGSGNSDIPTQPTKRQSPTLIGVRQASWQRSQKAFLTWEKFIRLVARFFPPIRILHPLPCHRFDAKTREEPGALAAHAGDPCGGRDWSVRNGQERPV
jgi:hypothetical protein